MITIIGCGVSGLTTGITLLEAGWTKVKIIAEQLPPHTTSNKAAAIWFPYKANPQDLVLKWSQESYAVFEELTQEPSSGVYFVDWCVLEKEIFHKTPWWTAALPIDRYHKNTIAELPEGYKEGYTAHVPMIETPIYMQYLLDRFGENGGMVEQRRIDGFEELLKQSPDTIIVNCTGLGAKYLCKDDELYPIQGHIVQLEADEEEEIGYIVDEHGPNAVAYMMPRKDCIVLGGTAEAHQYGLEVEESVVAGILKRCKCLEPKLKGKKVVNTYVGLRPYRSTIRLEREENRPIVHNYGHGGAGFTVSWGCAKEVLQLVSLRI